VGHHRKLSAVIFFLASGVIAAYAPAGLAPVRSCTNFVAVDQSHCDSPRRFRCLSSNSKAAIWSFAAARPMLAAKRAQPRSDSQRPSSVKKTVFKSAPPGQETTFRCSNDRRISVKILLRFRGVFENAPASGWIEMRETGRAVHMTPSTPLRFGHAGPIAFRLTRLLPARTIHFQPEVRP